ncbi:MAG: hypothetical protein IJ969_04965, partial [Anaerotignum sp.]|nr:hypothetical protein [Anaerotignum sp.]
PASGNLNIVLEEDTTMLEETVVVGYGVQKKSVVTAAILVNMLLFWMVRKYSCLMTNRQIWRRKTYSLSP